MAEFIETNRGGKALHYEGYIYTKIRDGLRRNTYTKKYKSDCTGRATPEGSNVVVRQEHNHLCINIAFIMKGFSTSICFNKFSHTNLQLANVTVLVIESFYTCEAMTRLRYAKVNLKEAKC